MNGTVEPMYQWRAVDGVSHAFNRFRNPPGSAWYRSLCHRQFSAVELARSTPRIVRGRIVEPAQCVACIHLVNAGSI